MPTPMPHQIEGALFLANRQAALLADEPRVGKTGAAIMACDYIFARKILVVTKSSARAQWGREFREWGFQRKIQVIYSGADKVDPAADVVVVGWGMVFAVAILKQLTLREWWVLILDESHEAKSPEAKRTRAVYSSSDAGHFVNLQQSAWAVWCLSGTPVPNTPIDLHPMLRSLAPERLKADAGKHWPDVTRYSAFLHRYCVVKKKYIGGEWREIPIKGRNEEELRARIGNFMLRRTQQDVGIGKPIYSVFAIAAGKISATTLEALAKVSTEAALVMAAVEAGEDVSEEDMHLGTLRRVTGLLKVPGVIEAAQEALDDGLDKLVLMAWHTDVIDALREGLSAYGVVGIDGRTPPNRRDEQVQQFRTPAKRVFVGQILAAGEAIDLSAACELWFVEPDWAPKNMKQASLRVTNHSQKRQVLVRVCALEGSIDEALMAVLTRKVESITSIMEN